MRRANRGFTLLEILLGVSIIAASFLGVLTVFDRLTKSSREMVELTKANFLLEEAVEAARTWRDNSWTNFANWSSGTSYYLVWSNGRWATTTSNTFFEGKFERKVRLNDVSRDATSDDIVSSGGTNDSGTKLFTATVAWYSNAKGATTTKTLVTYFSDIFN